MSNKRGYRSKEIRTEQTWRWLVGLDGDTKPPHVLVFVLTEFPRQLGHIHPLPYTITRPMTVALLHCTQREVEALKSACPGTLEVTGLFDPVLAFDFCWEHKITLPPEFVTPSPSTWSGRKIERHFLAWTFILDAIKQLVPDNLDVFRLVDVKDKLIALRLLFVSLPGVLFSENLLSEILSDPAAADTSVLQLIEGKSCAEILSQRKSLYALKRGGLTVIQIQQGDSWREFVEEITRESHIGLELERPHVFRTSALGLTFLIIATCSSREYPTLSFPTCELNELFEKLHKAISTNARLRYFDWERRRWFTDKRWNGCTWAPKFNETTGQMQTYGGYDRWTYRAFSKVQGIPLLNLSTFSIDVLAKASHTKILAVECALKPSYRIYKFFDSISLGAQDYLFDNTLFPREIMAHIISHLSILDVFRLFSPTNSHFWKSYEEFRFVVENASVSDKYYTEALFRHEQAPLSCMKPIPPLVAASILYNPVTRSTILPCAGFPLKLERFHFPSHRGYIFHHNDEQFRTTLPWALLNLPDNRWAFHFTEKGQMFWVDT